MKKTKIEELNEQIKEHEDIRSQLYVVTGTKPPTPIDWLKNLPVGTCFVTRGKNTKMYNLDEYHIAAHFPKTTVLVHNQNGPTIYLSVDSMRFSDAMEHFETLGWTTQSEETNYDERNTNIGPGGLEPSENVGREHTRFELPKDE